MEVDERPGGKHERRHRPHPGQRPGFPRPTALHHHDHAGSDWTGTATAVGGSRRRVTHDCVTRPRRKAGNPYLSGERTAESWASPVGPSSVADDVVQPRRIASHPGEFAGTDAIGVPDWRGRSCVPRGSWFRAIDRSALREGLDERFREAWWRMGSVGPVSVSPSIHRMPSPFPPRNEDRRADARDPWISGATGDREWIRRVKATEAARAPRRRLS
jgi:hypothetical protein